MPGRATIGLYNSYDPVKFREAHRRVLARAGPLALAFDCNLATFGFPYDRTLTTPSEVATWISESTSIGEGGEYLVELAAGGRFSTFDFPKKGFPPQLGEVIITTRKPDPPLTTTPASVRDLLESGKSVILVFGLGPHGLPRKVMEMGAKHLDVTGRRMSLETCTALGAIVAVIMHK